MNRLSKLAIAGLAVILVGGGPNKAAAQLTPQAKAQIVLEVNALSNAEKAEFVRLATDAYLAEARFPIRVGPMLTISTASFNRNTLQFYVRVAASRNEIAGPEFEMALTGPLTSGVCVDEYLFYLLAAGATVVYTFTDINGFPIDATEVTLGHCL